MSARATSPSCLAIGVSVWLAWAVFCEDPAAAQPSPAASAAATTASTTGAATEDWPSAARLLDEGTRAEQRLAFAEALALYRRTMAIAATSRTAALAARRVSWLEQRSEGDFGPLSRLMAMRADEETPTADEMAAFEAQIDGFPPGTVRREARAFCAQGEARAHRWTAAVVAYERWLDEPDLSDAERDIAQRGRAMALEALGGSGLDALSAAALGGSHEARFLRAQAWLRAMRIAAVAAAIAFAVAVVAARLWKGLALRGLRALVRARALATAACVLVTPVVLVRLYDATYARAAVALALAGAAGLSVASLAGASLDAQGASRRRRAVVAVVATLAQLALGFAALDRTGLLPELLAAWM